MVYIDTGLLRQSGLLELVAGSKAVEEPDYRKFVDQTGFDYRRDLDAVAAAFVDNHVQFLKWGRSMYPLDLWAVTDAERAKGQH